MRGWWVAWGLAVGCLPEVSREGEPCGGVDGPVCAEGLVCAAAMLCTVGPCPGTCEPPCEDTAQE